LSLGAVETVHGHGWITSPAPRQSSNCQHCLNGPQLCGASDATDAYKGPVVTWKEGSVVEVTIAVTAHHKGHYEFSICDKVITSSLAGAQACLDAHILERASAADAGIRDCQPGDRRAACQPIDERHRERFYLPPPGFSPSGGNTHTFYLKLPAGLKCEACTMQWRWWSANSCIPAPDYACFRDVLQSNGYSNADSWGLTNWAVKSCPGGGCNRCGCGEEFRNCVDISIEGAQGGSVPVPAPPAPTTPAPTTATTTTTMQQTSTTSTMPASGACRVVSVGGNTFGATPEKCEKTCSYLTGGQWPCSSDGPCDCSTTTQPTTAQPTTTQQAPAPSPAPTQTSACDICTGSGNCIWTNGLCYPVAKDACVQTAGTVYCGSD